MKKILVTIWLLFLIGVSLQKSMRKANKVKPSSAPCAASSLPVNHQLNLADLSANNSLEPDMDIVKRLTGKHLTVAKHPNDIITENDVSTFPVLQQSGKDTAFLYIPVRSEELLFSKLLHQGIRVQLCAAVQPTDAVRKDAMLCSFNPVEIYATHYKTKDAAEDWLLIKLAKNEIQAVHSFMAAKTRYMLIVNSP